MSFETHTSIYFPKKHFTDVTKEQMINEISFDKSLFDTSHKVEGGIVYFGVSMRGGVFADLEEHFKKNEIPFDRVAKDEEDGLFRYSYRPNEYEGTVELLGNEEDPAIPVDVIRNLVNKTPKEKLHDAMKKLMNKYDPDITPLERYNN